MYHFVCPKKLLKCLVTQRYNCWEELSIILSTASQSTKLKVILLIIPFWDRNSLVVLLLLLSQTALPTSPVIFIPDTLQIIPSCGSSSLVDTLCFQSSLANNFPSTLHSMFIYDGRSSSRAGILPSWFPHMLLNSNSSGIDFGTLHIAHKMSACFFCWRTLCTFLYDKNKALLLSHPTLTLPSITLLIPNTNRIKDKPPYIPVRSDL